ncbi:hypothetical protein CJD50_22300 [Hafnia paralvei]|mgnify:CR=1 FL=1|uniref:Host nuclease inhibitor GamL n=2 Tax=Hafnia TaxID=568 RepID=A0A2A2M6R6_9GAMM|nr:MULTISPECIES: host nuclease inhibitor GamL [Hafnia]EFV40489.1 hypothetical protein HMPREF0864_02220 [Enterobacteriaceae bacterium 9_2_54FAA]QHJ81900.1 MAG: hypothetical protein [Caudoviricetes sp.]NLS53851.1 host nuclease inhibitor GamL [Hafnia alvei]PAV94169.1 hypothetical protein CJD50_22300 [Hafnia paralvei]TBL55555.1 host nuclease inhibitor GamL [Hafnia paralvei]
MNAYQLQDYIEDQRIKQSDAELERQNWIDNRAEEILSEYPDGPESFAGFNLPESVRMGLYTSKAKDAYNEFITVMAWERAETEWNDKYGWAA